MDVKKWIIDTLPYGYVLKKIYSVPPFGESSVLCPEIYNKLGERISVYYLQDSLCTHTPQFLVDGRFPRRLMWDRFNKGLPIHFYTHKDMKRTSNLCRKKYGILRESEVIVPKDYEWALHETGQISEFEKVFTHSARILDRYENAVFAPANGVWYGTLRNGGEMSEFQYENKSKNISMVSSDKTMCPMHYKRIEVARHCISSGKVDVYGNVSGNYIEHKADALDEYRYSIAVENDITPYYFTEKILDCFASMTVPIYIGASEIGKFFNLDGIIRISQENTDKLDEVLKQCCERDYFERLDAIKDNYNRVKDFLCIEDYIMNNYKIDF